MAREKAALDEMRSFLREHTGHALAAVAVRLLDESESSSAPADRCSRSIASAPPPSAPSASARPASTR
ncbi:MAG: hypothetical protein R2939_00220 [Kofleriaceae bacterium]